MSKAITGRCLCGASSYRTESKPINIRVCHCKLCQKATGAPFFARVLVPLDELNIAGPVQWHNSSPEVSRGFCADCGSALFSKRASRNAIGLSFGSLDRPNEFAPEEHIWISEKQSWLHFDDGLPTHSCSVPT
ncbi:GFA family protein [Paracoccus tegillarcae]|uniref:GFA family protein n=1 Tax=Paracoccus tegillarcae TaxID=1529068 RepID=A0A2K9EWS6_9RHOB|nr:GFA family protein [Paracoccus tegillarcae]